MPLSFAAVTTACQNSTWRDRVRAVQAYLACATLAASGSTSGQIEYAHQVLQNPDYYLERGVLPMALGFLDRDGLAEELISDPELIAHALLLFQGLTR